MKNLGLFILFYLFILLVYFTAALLAGEDSIFELQLFVGLIIPATILWLLELVSKKVKKFRSKLTR